MSAPLVPKKRMNVAEFLAWSTQQPEGKRYELVEGAVVAMSPERVRHNLAKLEIALALRESVRSAKLPCTVFTDGMTVVINDHMARDPDAAVQCGVELDPDSMVLEAPLIVVEVVSPSSERDDSGVKLVEYFSVASIRHYLIVYPEKRAVVHHARNADGALSTMIAHAGDIVLDPPGLRVPVVGLLGPTFDQDAEGAR